jgi:carbonic anhydrase
MRHHRLTIVAVVLALTAVGLTARTDQSPAGSLERLKAGNARFVANASAALPVDAETRAAQVKGQTPFAMIVSCADSRVPPEIIFNAGLGELFIVRTAGQVADKAVLASIEYGAEHLHVPLLVVMGHEACGAVIAAVSTPAHAPSMGPNLDALIGAIRPAFDRMSTPADMEHLRDAVLANVEQVVNDFLSKSAIVKHMVAEEKLQVVGAYYEFTSGRVRFSQPLGADASPVPHKPAATQAAHK